MSDYILDACALLAFLKDEAGADIVSKLLDRAEREEITLGINAVNLIEVYYDRIRVIGAEQADVIIHEICNTFPITVIETLDAAILKAAGKMSFADTILVATARCTGATIVSCDHVELDPIEQQEHIPFLWIRQ